MTDFTPDTDFTMYRVHVLLSLRAFCGALTKSQIQRAVPKSERGHLDESLRRAMELELVIYDPATRRYRAGSVAALMASPEVTPAVNVRLARLYPNDRARHAAAFHAVRRESRRRKTLNLTGKDNT